MRRISQQGKFAIESTDSHTWIVVDADMDIHSMIMVMNMSKNDTLRQIARAMTQWKA